MKKGFTLIELLAVIVILAIIALIATPIVLNIIDDTKKSATIRSAEFYMDAVENSVATAILKNIRVEDGTYTIMKDGNVCIGTLTDNVCDGDILEVEVKGEKPTSGTITFKDGIISNVDLSISNKDLWNDPITGNLEYKLAPGLYDKNNKLLASWDELESRHNIKLKIEGEDYICIDEDCVETLSLGQFISSEYEDASKLIINEGVKKIGSGVFFETKLNSIVIPDGVESIENDAFRQSSLTNITIPDSVTSIGDSAFGFCKNLTSITIPTNVTSIGSSVFSYNSKLKTIVVDKNNSVYDSRDNSNTIIETATNTLLYGSSNTVIPDSVTSIRKSAFVGSGLTNITIPEGITSIDEDTFLNCSNLTNVVFPNSLNSIGKDAFSGTKLTNITIPANVTSIGDRAFAYTNIKSITIPSLVNSMGVNPFLMCEDLETIIVDENNIVYDSRDNSNAIIKTATNTLLYGSKNTIIPSSVTSIGMRAFFGSGLTSITIPGNVKTIDQYAFHGNKNLTNVIIEEGVTKINIYAFQKCPNLTSITIPSSVTSIGYSVFEEDTNLTTIKYKGTASGFPWGAENAELVTNF